MSTVYDFKRSQAVRGLVKATHREISAKLMLENAEAEVKRRMSRLIELDAANGIITLEDTRTYIPAPNS